MNVNNLTISLYGVMTLEVRDVTPWKVGIEKERSCWSRSPQEDVEESLKPIKKNEYI